MNNVEQSTGCSSWRTIGIILGALGILDSIGSGLFLLVIVGIYIGLIHVTVGILVICALNITASVFWLCGIFNKKPFYLLISLIWWIIPICIMIFLAVILCIRGPTGIIDNNKPEIENEENKIVNHATNLFDLFIIGSAVYGVIFYSLAVICYIKVKADVQRYVSEIPRLDVSYNATPQFDIY